MKRTFSYEIKNTDSPKVSAYLKSRGYSQHILSHIKPIEGSVCVNGAAVPMGYRLKYGDILAVTLTEEGSEKVIPVKLDFKLLYEDQDILVVNKPAGMPSHPARGVPEETLGNAVAYYAHEKGEDYVYRCMNRLDKNTSGLAIVAKNPLSATILQQEMRNRRIKRTYYAILEGIPTPRQATIDLPIGESPAEGPIRCIDMDHGKRAITHYEVLKTWCHGEFPLSMVELHLDTGRTHQIRVHMSHIGHPLVGDHLYNQHYVNRKQAAVSDLNTEFPDASLPQIKRHALHAGGLVFTHPITGEPLEFRTNLPEDMSSLLS